MLVASQFRDAGDDRLRGLRRDDEEDDVGLADDRGQVRQEVEPGPIGEPGLSAIAAPIRSSRGDLEAIAALQGPSSRFNALAIEAALPYLLETAAAISRELGWRADSS